MSKTVADRLSAAGVTLPNAPAPAANYVPFVRSGGQLFISGQVPMDADGLQFIGKLGDTMDVDEAQKAARLCAINILAQANAALGSLEGARLVKLTGFVNSAPGFGDQPKVINGASDFMVAILGEKGRHARSAVGVAALPFGVSVEIEAIFEVEG
ncbi:MAG: RidA family protein [Pseudomonadota bacterium]